MRCFCLTKDYSVLAELHRSAVSGLGGGSFFTSFFFDLFLELLTHGTPHVCVCTHTMYYTMYCKVVCTRDDSVMCVEYYSS